MNLSATNPSQEGNWPRRPAPLLGGVGGGFMVLMHAHKAKRGSPWTVHGNPRNQIVPGIENWEMGIEN